MLDRTLPKAGTEFLQVCDGCRMLGFCTRIILRGFVFISSVEIFNYAEDWWDLLRAVLGEPNRGHGLKMAGIKPSGRRVLSKFAIFFVYPNVPIGKRTSFLHICFLDYKLFCVSKHFIVNHYGNVKLWSNF